MSRAILIRCCASVVLAGRLGRLHPEPGQAAAAVDHEQGQGRSVRDRGDGGNVAVYITNEGVILVDDKYDQDHDQIMAKVKSVTNQPINYILSTHYHADHSGGNTRFPAHGNHFDAQRAQQHRQPRAVQCAARHGGRARDVHPEDRGVPGRQACAGAYYGRGHTNGDAVIYFPALRVVHTGDLMTSRHPADRLSRRWQPEGMDDTLDGVMKLDFDTVIPGHGPVTNKAEMLTYRDNVDKQRKRVQD